MSEAADYPDHPQRPVKTPELDRRDNRLSPTV
jgi:hypothetical protein